jgi:hypothetical protein
MKCCVEEHHFSRKTGMLCSETYVIMKLNFQITSILAQNANH